MSEKKRDRSGSWPAWIAPLRPDDVSRARMRSVVLDRAEAWLERRGTDSVWELAADAALRLVPVAACALLLFGWLAHRAERQPVAASSNVAVEELVRSGAPRAQGPPAVLTAASAPSQELVLAATLRGQD